MSRLIVGCMGLGGAWDRDAQSTPADLNVADALLHTAVDLGITHFDHADIYRHGRAEQVFGDALAASSIARDSLHLQSKCGIRFADDHGPKRYDWSGEWIVSSVEGSLRRLRTDYLDTLLLHRPDPLMHPDEVAAAFDQLRQSGKVRFVGVSNASAAQMAFLQDALNAPLAANQIELHLLYTAALDEVVTTGQREGGAVNFTPGTLEYARQHGVAIQCWGSLCQGWLSGRDIRDQPKHVVTTAKHVAALAQQHGVPREAIVLAWLLRHPAGFAPVIGTTSPARLQACAAAQEVHLSREDWYALWISARGAELP